MILDHQQLKTRRRNRSMEEKASCSWKILKEEILKIDFEMQVRIEEVHA